MLSKRLVPKISFKNLRNILIVVVIISLSFSIGQFIGFRGYQIDSRNYPNVTISRAIPPEHQEDFSFSLFWQVWDMLESKYYDKEKLIPSKMVYGAIKGMVNAIGDPYTVFLPPDDNKVVEEDLQGSFEGVGIQIGFKGNNLSVIAPLPESPAERAGVMAGDLIAGIRDEVKGIDMGTVGIALPEAVQAIRGPAGTKVTLSLLRDGNEEIIETDIIRENIDVPSIDISFIDESGVESDGGDIAYIRILKFAGETQSEWEDAVISILKEPRIDGIILDVRNNPGGYLQAAIDLAGDFTQIGTVVVTEEKSDGFVTEYETDKIGRLRSYDTVLLVNKGSASASEILAGALRDINDVQIVGTTTFGKGTIQEPEQIEGGAGLHITIARWLTPSGYWVNDKGLVPDVEIEDNPETEEDEQLQEVIRVLIEK